MTLTAEHCNAKTAAQKIIALKSDKKRWVIIKVRNVGLGRLVAHYYNCQKFPKILLNFPTVQKA